ncbi:MAG: helix-turn-helix transcriptional regulator [Candidatus Limnocylindrales bacterium]
MPAPISPVHGAIGAELRRLRVERGLTQHEVADRVGVHRTYLNQIEAGSRNVSLGILAKLAYVLETRLSSVVGVADGLDP